jgi:hypothetical protein
MIKSEVFNPVRDRLRAKGLPTAIECIYGPPPVPMKVGATRLYMCTDDEVGDAIGGPKAQRPNPKHVGVRAIGAMVVIYAHSTEQGADRGDHEEIALTIADMVHAALHSVIRAGKSEFRVTRAGFRADETTDGWAGRVYEMRLSIDTAIEDLTWKGAALPEVSAPRTTTTLDANGTSSTDLPNATTRVN